jgi:hypothetical protein
MTRATMGGYRLEGRRGFALARTFGVAAALFACAAPLQAADRLRAGEWAVEVKVSQQGGPQIAPDELAKMKKLGIATPFAGEPIMVTQCITAEMAAADKPFTNDPDDPNRCQVVNAQRSGNRVAGEMVCTGDMQGKGPFVMDLESDTAYRGQWTVTGVSRAMGAVEQVTEIKGRWIRAACAAPAR